VVKELDHFGVAAPGADPDLLRRELEEAHRTIHQLLRQMRKDQARYDEIARAYTKTVTNLVEITRENVALEQERDLWKMRANRTAPPVGTSVAGLDLTPAEIGAIRKAMARLHHPDVGGDPERMKAWNAALDPLEG